MRFYHFLTSSIKLEICLRYDLGLGPVVDNGVQLAAVLRTKEHTARPLVDLVEVGARPPDRRRVAFFKKNARSIGSKIKPVLFLFNME
jgi:hypothetical protein